MKCYSTSPEALQRLAEIGRAASAKTCGHEVGIKEKWTCLSCGQEQILRVSKAKKKKFCNYRCYRKYMAERFDRYIANPETIALPQCYDEFLNSTELHCLIEGCDWIGKALSNHMNFAHGIPADKFKEMAGFNRKTGVVSSDMAKNLAARHQQWNGPPENMNNKLTPSKFSPKPEVRLEGREHLSKSSVINAAIAKAKGGPRFSRESRKAISISQAKHAADKTGAFTPTAAICTMCGTEYTTTSRSASRHITLCSKECRAKRHKEIYTSPHKYELTCSKCGKKFLGSYCQLKASKKQRRISCSKQCLRTTADEQNP